jgi:hypothetical protein
VCSAPPGGTVDGPVASGGGSVALGAVATGGEVDVVDVAPVFPPPESSPQAARPSARAARSARPEPKLK